MFGTATTREEKPDPEFEREKTSYPEPVEPEWEDGNGGPYLVLLPEPP